MPGRLPRPTLDPELVRARDDFRSARADALRLLTAGLEYFAPAVRVPGAVPRPEKVVTVAERIRLFESSRSFDRLDWALVADMAAFDGP